MEVIFRNSMYDLCLFDPLPATDVRIAYDPVDSLVLSPSMQSEKVRIIEACRQGGKCVQLLPLYRFRSVGEESGAIAFRCGPTDFGEYLLTDVSHPEWRSAGIPMANPLSVSAVAESSDHQLLLGYRSGTVVFAEGKIQSLPGGYIHPPAGIAGTVEAELREELGVVPEEVASMSVTGLARIHPSAKPEVLLHIVLSCTALEILGRHGADSWEFRQKFTVPAAPGPVQALLRNSGDGLAPASHAALAAYAFHEFGTAPSTF